MTIHRFSENPLIRPDDVKPWIDGFGVVGVFNAGVARLGDEIILLLRVAEAPSCEDPDGRELAAPFLDPENPSRGLRVLRVRRDDPDVLADDPRVFTYRGQPYLTSISHLRLARSRDGRHFTVDPAPALVPERPEEAYGVEDPRVTRIGEVYYVNYTAVSPHGIATALATTRDFVRFERKGVIFPVENRDVTIFPRSLHGRFVCYHRPTAGGFGRPSIWLASSPDLLHWGGHRWVCGPRTGLWDGRKIGAGAVPIETRRGWLEIYHGVDETERYALGLLLTDRDAPDRVLARSQVPVLEPEADYEREGFFSRVVFTCGALVESEGKVLIYYGAADQYIAGAEVGLDDLLATLV